MGNLGRVWLVFLFACVADAATEIYNVNNYGAIDDGKTDSSKAFLNAWKEACAVGGRPTVLIPQGTFLVGPVTFQGPCQGAIVFQLEGAVKAPSDLASFNLDNWIVFESINGFTITGHGTFDGQGALAWPHNKCPTSEKCKLLPTSIKFVSITNATIRGISSIDSKLFHMLIFMSKDIKLESLKITAPGDSPNTDGIHIGSSSGVTITNSAIGTGDDCISIGPGSKNISISNILCGPGHGISVGSLGKFPNEEDVVGLSVRNCTLTETTNGVRIKTWQASPVSTASNFTFEDIVMNNVYNPIIIDQQYCPYSSCNQEFPSHVKIRDVSFSNIRGISTSKIAVNLLCSKDVPCDNVMLKDINLEFNEQDGVSTSSCSNVKGSASGHQIPPACL